MGDATRASVTTFFESYRTAFARFDAAAIADHFAFPCHVSSDIGEIRLFSVPSREAWLGQVGQLLTMYRMIGCATAQVLDLAVTAISPGLIQAVVQWELRDGMGQTLYRFTAGYTLAQVGDGLRITAIGHNEMPQYRACLARIEAERAGGSTVSEAAGEQSR